MAKQLNLEEQEQLDELKHFWQNYGNLITWLLIAVFGTIAVWNGYQYWQRNQAVAAAGLFDEAERFATAGDLPQLERAFTDIKEKYASSIYAQQAGLMLGKTAHDKGNAEVAKAALTWVAGNASDEGLGALARLRLSGLQLEAKAYADALQTLAASFPPSFDALVADRKGDILALQGKRPEAIAEYNKAYAGLDERQDYRRLVEIKLTSLGVEVAKPGAPLASASAATAAVLPASPPIPPVATEDKK